MRHLSRSVALALMVGCLCFGNLVAYAGDYDNGLASYRKKDYKAAAMYFTSAAKQNRNDANSYFYLGLCYAKLNQFEKAQKVFEHTLTLTPANSKVAQKTRKNLAVIQGINISQQGGGIQKAKAVVKATTKREDNYLAHAITTGKIIRWDTKQMPLKIYIEGGQSVPGWQPSYTAMVMDSARQWQHATGNRVRFSQTNKKNKADIIVSWQKQLKHDVVGVSPYSYQGDVLIRSDVILSTYSALNGQPLSREQIRRTAIHEMGHAIGIRGHSPFPDDIMYYSANPSQSSTISSRDRRTIGMLYKLEADVQNSSVMTTAQTKDYYKLHELGVKAYQAKNYSAAINYYEQARRLNTKDGTLLYNMGLAYQGNNQNSSAISYYRKALKLDPGHIGAQYNLGILLLNEGVDDAKNNKLASAKSKVYESVNLLEKVNNSSDRPPGTSKALTTAKKNMTLLNQY